MITTEYKKVTVNKKITTYKCDFCDFSTKNNQGCCGVLPIEVCDICEKDICRDHREFFTEDYISDYPSGFYACPNCEPTVREIWEDEIVYAPRYESVIDNTIERARKILLK